jgi:endonuclease/exonuclease/phosphatase (EEP) superfamily protein YafD
MYNRGVSLYKKLIDEHSPDIILLAEPDEWWEEQLRPIRLQYPHSVLVPQTNTYGMLLYSKLPLSDTRIEYRVEPDVPSICSKVTLRTGDRFDLMCLHPRPPHPGNDTDSRDAELVLVAKQIKDSNIPIIVCGDLNDVAWSHTTRLFLRLSHLLDPRLGRQFCNTFPVSNPFFRWPLDHLFHSRSFRFVTLRRLHHCGSDHFPVLVELSYEPEEKHEQEPPKAAAEDHHEAREKLENVGK